MNRYDYGLTLSQEWIVLSNMGNSKYHECVISTPIVSRPVIFARNSLNPKTNHASNTRKPIQM